ncbi:MAG: hypothetical protein KGH60_00460 [Candidatus Micrarchaeota archaeon]|nr:hypothetical protein [Candidatus Micrarchaeota archaeon]
MMRNMRAQFWSFDVIFAVVIFSIAITILAFTWFNVNNQLAIGYNNGGTLLQLQAQSLSQQLMTPGSPSNWQSSINTTNTMTWGNASVGLASSIGNYSLSSSKVIALSSMSNYKYQSSKAPLNTAFDYYITIRGNPNNGAALNISIGQSPTAGKAQSVFLEKRSTFINGVPATMYVYVWSNSTIAAT